VAGGRDSIPDYHTLTDKLISSTEKLTIGDDAWIYGNPLPRKIWGVATVSLDNKVFLTGKLIHRIGILLMF
jgi:hypothetical protein